MASFPLDMTYRDILLEKIEKVTSGAWTVPEFREDYYWYMLNDVPEDAFSGIEEEQFFALVREQLEWTTANMTPEAKRDGYMSHEEYIDWVRQNTEEFLNDQESWYQNYLRSFGGRDRRGEL
jgi:hypothetical protein